MTTLTIDRWWKNTLLLGTLIVGWAIVSVAVEAAFWSDLARGPSPTGWITLWMGGAFFVVVLFFLITYATGRLATVARFGDDLQFSTLLVERRLAWSDVGRIVFKEMSMSWPCKFTIKFVIVDGTRFDVYATARQAEELLALVDKQTLAVGWPGQPLSPGAAWAILGLGLVALATGIRLGVALSQEVPGAPAVPALGKGFILAIGIPLLGLVSIGFAGYHLWCRPIVLRPGVYRIKEAEAMTLKSLVRQLFGQFD